MDINELLAYLEENGLLAYGAHFHKSVIGNQIGVYFPSFEELTNMPAFEAVKLYEKNQLAMLSCTSAIRKKLIVQGRYLKQQNDEYRILLPSENAAEAASQVAKGRGFIDRAEILIRNTHFAKSERAASRLTQNLISMFRQYD